MAFEFVVADLEFVPITNLNDSKLFAKKVETFNIAKYF